MMKRLLIFLALCLVCFSGCSSGISQEEYDVLKSEKAALEKEKNS